MTLKSYLPAFTVLVLIAVYHAGAIANKWYFYYNYTDIVMHLLGGFFLAYTFWWVLMRLKGKGHSLPPSVMLGLMICVTLIIGLGWELFEYRFGLTYPEHGNAYAMDTIMDLCMDLWGAIIAGFALVIFKAKGFMVKMKK